MLKITATLLLCSVIGSQIRAATPENAAVDIINSSGVQGGLVVHVGCSTGEFTAGLQASEAFLVHGLADTPADLQMARDHIQSRDLYGKVSVDIRRGQELPYAAGIVSLLVVSRECGKLAGEEIERVLRPGGVAVVRGPFDTAATSLDLERQAAPPDWIAYVKRWPAGMDQWTHYLHDADGNPVADDCLVGPPRHIKWRAKPAWGRQHRYGNKTAMVSAQGRLFYVDNEVEPCIEQLPDRPFLVARDAFSGVTLWKQPIVPVQMDGRLPSQRERDGCFLYEPAFPMELKLVVHDTALYLAFGSRGEIQVVDAATGKLRKVFENTAQTEEILYHRGKLVTVAAGNVSRGLDRWRYSARELNDLVKERARASTIRVLDAATGAVQWEYDSTDHGGLQVSPVAWREKVFVVVGGQLACFDLDDGRQHWIVPLQFLDQKKKSAFRSAFYIKGPSIYDHLIAADDIILLVYTAGKPYSTRTYLDAYSVDAGKLLWQHECISPHRAGAAAYVVDDRVWVHAAGAGKPLVALDLKTGSEEKRIDCTKVFDVGHHHRCYGNRATNRFLLTGRRGIEFIGFDSGEIRLHHWIRGKCRFGVLPCNGLLYTLPHACSCYPFSTLNGYAALASGTENEEEGRHETGRSRLEKGSAYGRLAELKPISLPATAWPTYRHDPQRSGSTASAVPTGVLKVAWKRPLGDSLTSLTGARDQIFVCDRNGHRVYSLASRDGSARWSFTAGGTVDSPPTLYHGLVFFGCADGYVYCLRADNGELAWRFRAAPRDRRIVADGGLESVWPVHGAILVQNGIVYCSAGRTSLLDGGIAVYGLEPGTGEVVAQHVIHDTYHQAEPDMIKNDGRNYQGDIGVLQDVLVGDGTDVYLRQLKLDPTCKPIGKSDQLISGNGLLRAAWFSRIGWYFGQPTVETRRSNANRAKGNIERSVRQGQYLVFDNELTYSVRIHPNVGKFSHYFTPGDRGYGIFADNNEAATNQWNVRVPIRVEAMVTAGNDTLLLAGPPDTVDTKAPWAAIDGKRGGVMWAVSSENGHKRAETSLDSPPVFDGLMLLNERIFMSLRNGHVVCYTSSDPAS